MSTNYTVERKKKLIEKIQKLTSKADFEHVVKIISKNNSDIQSMQNANAMFLKFGSLTNETYDELSKFIDKIEQRKLKQMKDEIMESSDLYSAEESLLTNNKTTSDKNISKKLRLTNNESHIINRVKYEKELKKNENMCSSDDSVEIFNSNSLGKKNTKITTQKKSDIFIHADEEDSIHSKNQKTKTKTSTANTTKITKSKGEKKVENR